MDEAVSTSPSSTSTPSHVSAAQPSPLSLLTSPSRCCPLTCHRLSSVVSVLYSWRLVQRPAYDWAQHRHLPLPVYTDLPLTEWAQGDEDGERAASLTTLCWPHVPRHLLTQPKQSSATLSSLCSHVLLALATPTVTASCQPLPARLNNWGVLRGQSLDELRHPQDLFALRL